MCVCKKNHHYSERRMTSNAPQLGNVDDFSKLKTMLLYHPMQTLADHMIFHLIVGFGFVVGLLSIIIALWVVFFYAYYSGQSRVDDFTLVNTIFVTTVCVLAVIYYQYIKAVVNCIQSYMNLKKFTEITTTTTTNCRQNNS